MEFVLKLQESQLRQRIVGPLADLVVAVIAKIKANEQLSPFEETLLTTALAGYMGAAIK